jgi:hypothetical protein
VIAGRRFGLVGGGLLLVVDLGSKVMAESIDGVAFINPTANPELTLGLADLKG